MRCRITACGHQNSTGYPLATGVFESTDDFCLSSLNVPATLLRTIGQQHNSTLAEPLIMDDNVIDALEDLTKEPWQGESVADYTRYIDLARQVAYEANTSADVVEWRLWGWKSD